VLVAVRVVVLRVRHAAVSRERAGQGRAATSVPTRRPGRAPGR
jgi:hypothetical protein